jgi:hypothetical protein
MWSAGFDVEALVSQSTQRNLEVTRAHFLDLATVNETLMSKAPRLHTWENYLGRILGLALHCCVPIYHLFSLFYVIPGWCYICAKCLLLLWVWWTLLVCYKLVLSKPSLMLNSSPVSLSLISF